MNDNLENENQKENSSTIKYVQPNVELKTIRKKEEKNIDTIEDFNKELELLKSKCEHYENALNGVLFYIVPDQCRKMVETSLSIGKSDFTKTSL
jgi:hypothetical protein